MTRGVYVIAGSAALVVWLAGLVGEYGWFADELYFVACAKRPAFGYADHPPLAPVLLTALRAIAGDALAVVRLVPALAFAGTIVLGARLARQLGGERFAVLLAAGFVATTPALLVIAGFYSMNPIDVLVATAISSVLLDIVQHDRRQRWVLVGALLGVGLLSKHTAIVPAGLFGAATLLSPARRHFLTPWPYVGGLVAAAIVAPHVDWLATHDWITLEFYGEATRRKNVDTTVLGALGGQALFVGPVGFVCALVGAGWLCRRPGLRGFGIAVFVGLAVMMGARVSRPDRIVGLYPLALAAGAVVATLVLRERPRLRRHLIVGYAISVAVPLPILVPILPPPTLAWYADALNLTPQLERQKPGAMPQWMADRLSWRELVAQTAAVAATLPSEERARLVVLGADYGVAGALELYGPELGLPEPVISTHNGWWLWGPTAVRDPVWIAVTRDEEMVRRLFADVRRADTVRCAHCFQDGVPIWIGRSPRVPIAGVWPTLRHLQ